jgi:PAS domain S-box-containing protein
MQDVSLHLIVFLIASAVLSFLVLYGLVKLFVSVKKKQKGEDEHSNVGFVVDTFHGLVAQLKEKEKELDVLRTRAEERAGLMEDYSENILRSVPSGVVSLDGNWRTVTVNTAAERILEIRAEDVAGKDISAVFTGSVDLKSLGTVERGETQYITPSRKRRWLGYSFTPLVDASEEVIGQLLIFTDLTELKALQSQVELRQRLASLGEMAAGIAHELRNPMGVIDGYMRLLSKKVDPSLAQTVEAVSEEVALMNRIITEFLSFARPRELNLEDVNLRGLLEECRGSVLGDREDVEVSIQVEDDVTIRADRTLLRQAFTNLIQNAADAQEGGGSIAFTGTAEDEFLILAVGDAGPGIDEEIREKVFLPFFTTKEQGTGLGLPLVHRIITGHGGSIEILDTVEGGTMFRVKLPR